MTATHLHLPTWITAGLLPRSQRRSSSPTKLRRVPVTALFVERANGGLEAARRPYVPRWRVASSARGPFGSGGRRRPPPPLHPEPDDPGVWLQRPELRHQPGSPPVPPRPPAGSAAPHRRPDAAGHGWGGVGGASPRPRSDSSR